MGRRSELIEEFAKEVGSLLSQAIKALSSVRAASEAEYRSTQANLNPPPAALRSGAPGWVRRIRLWMRRR